MPVIFEMPGVTCIFLLCSAFSIWASSSVSVAMWIWGKLENDLKGLASVSVSEGNSYGCEYFGEKNA